MADERTPEQRRVDGYVETVGRMEPEIHMVDRDAALTSIAISLKRIADALERHTTDPAVLYQTIENAIYAGITSARK